MDAREISAVVIADVLVSAKNLDHALAARLGSARDQREKKLARELCYGVMRWYHRLAFITDMTLKRPLKTKDADVLSLIYSGLYQLAYLRIPDHAAISASVETARKLHKPWASELINAVLRRYQRERDTIEKKAAASETARYSHPGWMISAFREQWPDHWRDILDADNRRPPLHLRLNLGRQSRETYLKKLAQAGIDAMPGGATASGVVIATPVNVEDIPGFENGDVSVQDFGAQLAAPLLRAAPGQRVLDACAAPGGKAGHLLELVPDLRELIAVDIDPGRIALLQNTLDRLRLRANVIQADINAITDWWDGEPFDGILLDAPCSATGVIRRHPDIKYLRAPGQLELYRRTQQRMLDSLWPLLKPGGRLVFATCSILREESDDQIASFASKYNDTMVEAFDADWGIKSQYGRHTLPGYDETDGFFYSVVVKRP